MKREATPWAPGFDAARSPTLSVNIHLSLPPSTTPSSPVHITPPQGDKGEIANRRKELDGLHDKLKAVRFVFWRRVVCLSRKGRGGSRLFFFQAFSVRGGISVFLSFSYTKDVTYG